MITISNTTKKQQPRLPYEAIATDILGKRYTLSLSFIGATRAKTLNQTYRGKTYIPNVLSFPLDDTVGEIYINQTVAEREAPKFNLSTRGYIAFLFIHGCLHLKGHDHGEQMDKLEQKYLKKYGLK